jgi:hypothetical protein
VATVGGQAVPALVLDDVVLIPEFDAQEGSSPRLEVTVLLSGGDQEAVAIGGTPDDPRVALVPMVTARILPKDIAGLPEGVVVPRGIRGRHHRPVEAMAQARRLLIQVLERQDVSVGEIRMDGIGDSGEGLETDHYPPPFFPALSEPMQEEADAWWGHRRRELELCDEAASLAQGEAGYNAALVVLPALDRTRFAMDIAAQSFRMRYGVQPYEVINIGYGTRPEAGEG